MRPSSIRRKVVLPQPDAPTMLTNSPSAIDRDTLRRASTLKSPLTNVFERLVVASLMVRSCMSRPRILEAIGRKLLLDPLQKFDADNPGDGEEEDAGEEASGVERIARN